MEDEGAGAEGLAAPKLDAVADARWVRTTSEKVTASAADGGNLAATPAAVTRVRVGLRVGLEGSWPVLLDEGATLTPRLRDGGDRRRRAGVAVSEARS